MGEPFLLDWKQEKRSRPGMMAELEKWLPAASGFDAAQKMQEVCGWEMNLSMMSVLLPSRINCSSQPRRPGRLPDPRSSGPLWQMVHNSDGVPPTSGVFGGNCRQTPSESLVCPVASSRWF